MKSFYIHSIYIIVMLILTMVFFIFFPIYYASSFNEKYRTRAVQEASSGVFRSDIAYKLTQNLGALKNKSFEEVVFLLDGISNYQNFDKKSNKGMLILTYTSIDDDMYFDQANSKKYFWYSSQDKLQDLLLEFKENKLVAFEYIKGP